MRKATFEPAFFRMRADQCRHLAQGMHSNKKIQGRLISLASEYEALAAQFETRRKPADLAQALARRSQLRRRVVRLTPQGKSRWLH
jgi:hypothetical protein